MADTELRPGHACMANDHGRDFVRSFSSLLEFFLGNFVIPVCGGVCSRTCWMLRLQVLDCG